MGENNFTVAAMEFDDFIKRYMGALDKGDRRFLKGVYAEWSRTSGGSGSLKALLEETRAGLENSRVDRKDCFGDFCVVRMRGPYGLERSLTFRRSGKGWSYFDERSGLAAFRKVYSISYEVRGKSGLRMLFGGQRAPVMEDIEGDTDGYVSIINSALRKGENEISLIPLAGRVDAWVKISSCRRGGTMDLSAGDALSWRGTIDGPYSLRFRAD